MLLDIFACALALAAVVLGALAWTISLRLKLETELRHATTQSNLSRLAAKQTTLHENFSAMKSTSAPKLAAEVAELSDAVARLAKTQQRFAGKYYAEGGPAARSNNQPDIDDELAAELALQNAAPVAPGRT